MGIAVGRLTQPLGSTGKNGVESIKEERPLASRERELVQWLLDHADTEVTEFAGEWAPWLAAQRDR